jgi:TrmH family RNA methyltransferase
MIEISSKNNETYKSLSKIVASASQRRKLGLYIIEGEKIVREAFMGSQDIDKIVINSKGIDIIKDFDIGESIEVILFSEELFDSVSDTVNSQGIIALMKIPNYELYELNFNKVLVIDKVQDPGNLGTLIRSADAFGFNLVISLKGSCDIYNPKVVRSTMGSIFHLPIVKDFSEKDAMKFLKSRNTIIYTTNLSERSVNINEVKLMAPFAVVIGNESNGVSQFWAEKADENIIIPMYGKAESLNAGVAGSIIMYQFSCM